MRRAPDVIAAIAVLIGASVVAYNVADWGGFPGEIGVVAIVLGMLVVPLLFPEVGRPIFSVLLMRLGIRR